MLSLTYPAMPNSGAYTLVCYMQTADGSTLDLEKLCVNSSKNCEKALGLEFAEKRLKARMVLQELDSG